MSQKSKILTPFSVQVGTETKYLLECLETLKPKNFIFNDKTTTYKANVEGCVELDFKDNTYEIVITAKKGDIR